MLTMPNGDSCDAALENEGITEGQATLTVPSVNRIFVTAAIQQYWANQNPTLTNAAKMYSESLLNNPNIPKTVFTKNIATLLARKVKKSSDSVDDISSVLSPASSLTGGATAASKGSKHSIAWKYPLQETSLKHSLTGKTARRQMTSKELNHRKQIAILEVQLALKANTTDRNSVQQSSRASQSNKSSRASSRDSSRASSKSAGLKAASAHARLDELKVSFDDFSETLKNIENLMLNNRAATEAPATPSTSHATEQPSLDSPPPTTALALCDQAPAMTGLVLFPEDDPLLRVNNTLLDKLDSPTKRKNSKRHRPPSSPSISSPQYNKPKDSRGKEQC